jgi:cytochrome c oxidase subunit IV
MPILLATTITAGETGSGLVKAVGGLVGYMQQQFMSINWAAPTWDLFIVIFFIVTVFLYGMSLGRDRIIVILVSIYMSMAVVSNAPYIGGASPNADVNFGNIFAFKVSAFLGLFILLFFLLSRSALTKTFGSMAAGKWWQIFAFSVFHVGLLVSITLSFLPSEALAHLTPVTRQLFATEIAQFIWVVSPIAGMVLLKGD